MDSILTSVKKMLGIAEDYVHFDPELIMHINSIFMVLNQEGIGPEKPFKISDKTAVWTDFLPDGDLEAIRTFVYLRVRLIFDPPANSMVQQSYQEIIKELEWRLYNGAEFGFGTNAYAENQNS